MPLNTEQIAALIREATARRFRRDLVSRGLSRSILWTDGRLPEGAPNYSPNLSADLLDYGFSLLDLGLQLRSQDKAHPLLTVAFERAAESIEAVVRRGDPQLVDRGFLTIAAGAAYHLGHFSARAFSLFTAPHENLNFSPAERTLRNLFIRDLATMRADILQWAGSRGFDSSLSEILRRQASSFAPDDTVDLLLNTQFHKALACFEFALETGNKVGHDNAVTELELGTRAANDFHHIPFWWLFVITRHLVDDLWDSSLYVRMPSGPSEPDASSWTSLRKFFIATLINRSVAEVDLWPSQFVAVDRAYDVNDDLVVSLPTSAGKTRIAEVCILRTLSLSQRVVFVTPLRALSAQTERTLRRTFVPLGFSVSSLYGSSGLTGEDVDSLGNRDIVVTTPEKLDFALRNNPSLIDAVGLIVLDEGHSIGIQEREVRYEVLVDRLLKRPDASGRRIVCLSALLPSGEELNDFVAWLRQDQPGEPVTCDWRATRQRFGHIVWRNDAARLTFRVDSERPFVPAFLVAQPGRGRRRRSFPSSGPEFTLATAWKFVEQGQTVLVYCPIRRSVESLAQVALDLKKQGYLNSLLPPDLSDVQQQHLAEAINIGSEWLGAFHPAVLCLHLGVAIHHGTLPRPFQRAVERLLRDQILKVTIASPTLSQGLNLSATTLLFHSIFRNRSTIPPEEFINVAGRAGRAFVDVEGQVVCVDFENRLARAWDELLQTAQKRSVKSGLLRLVLQLCIRLHEKTQQPLAELVEYVANNSAVWDPPPATEDEPNLPQIWQSELARLDAAILALLPHDAQTADLARILDETLAGSLWQRSLVNISETGQPIAKGLLLERSKFIWNNSTGLERRGAFYAGVSFTTGQQLSAQAARLNELLVSADSKFAEGNFDEAMASVVQFAEIVFSIEPFKPEELPPNWQAIAKDWVAGKSLADIAGGIETETVNFLENALVYRLVWALEAVRVRAVASGELDESDFNGHAAMAIETGTHSYAASLLIHCGLASRIAAIKAVHDTDANFVDARGMRRWVFSEEVKSKTQDSNWPTPQTSSLWREFVQSLTRQAVEKWEEKQFDIAVSWQGDAPRVGSPIRIKDGKYIYSMKWDFLGTLRQEISTDGGTLIAHVGTTGATITGKYLGPRE